ncbi:MAG: RnfABCDGE type electron transport complex subunit D [Alphaproteobacteria bacterium]|nr:RnfABCDGE type electron transport complex subunit D [Alphaproteobacteria bacterium]
MLKKSTTPHMLSNQTTQSVMFDVVLALFPTLIVSVLFFGLKAVLVLVTSVTACLTFEYICNRFWLMKERNSTRDFSAVITALLLACSLPSNLPLIFVVFGAFVAIVIAKMSFGGLGKNIFNPALSGRVFLFLSFPVYMTSWPKPSFNNFFQQDVSTGATTLELIKYSDASTSATRLDNNDYLNEIPDYFDMITGYIAGSLGEVSAIALLLGLAYLLYRNVITWHIPFFYILTVFLTVYVVSLFSEEPLKYSAVTHVLSGGLLLGAIFMATDYVTSPMSEKGKIIFAIGCGLLTVLIRLTTVYSEGVSFAILIMNAFVPFIDRISVPRIYGTGGKK